MDKSSGEKNIKLRIPNNSLDFLIGIPSIATPLGLFFSNAYQFCAAPYPVQQKF